jgi:hypothetical protein
MFCRWYKPMLTRFRTKHAGAEASFVCVGRCLGVVCVLLIVVMFCYTVGVLVAFFRPPC